MKAKFIELKEKIDRKIDREFNKRIEKKPYFNDVEFSLGMFVEMLEPQVKNAVLKLNKKGYATDRAGFGSDYKTQILEGDFQLDDKTSEKLQSLGVLVVTNPSKYTTLQFSPASADLKRIQKVWDSIAQVFPDLGKVADLSMTSRSRELRQKYSKK